MNYDLQGRVSLMNNDFHLKVDFQVPSAKTTALLGRSGSGKTTFLRWLAGLVGDVESKAGGGCFLQVGQELWHDSKKNIFVPAHKRSVGYVFQENNLFPHLTVEKNIEYALKRIPHQFKNNEIETSAKMQTRTIFEMLGVEKLLKKNPDELSGGERQRVAITRALCSQPQLLLLDEPLSGLDLISKREILPYLELVKSEIKIPIVFVSHALDEIERFCDYMLVLENGHLKQAGNLDLSWLK